MEIFVKDMELKKFLRKFPELSQTLNSMRARLPDGHRAYLVDYVVMDCVPGMGTCRDTRWHVDGDPKSDNLYVLRVEGPNRTEFLAEPADLPELPEGREEQNRILEDLLKDRLPLRIPDGEEMVYDSRTPHRGVLCDEHGRRTFLRLMATNYIKPKNIIRRGNDVPFRPAA